MGLIQRLFFLPFLFTVTFVQGQIVADFTMSRSGGCSPLNVSFTGFASGASSNAKFSWDLGNGNRSELRNPSGIYTEEKVYSITLTITDGNQTSTKTRTITVYKKPTVDFSSVKPKVCIPEMAQFLSTSSAGDGSISNYQWDFGDGIIQQFSSASTTHAYLEEQLATVSLTVTNSYGCQASITKPNIVEVLPRIVPQISANRTLLCSLGDTVKFTNTSTGPGPLQYLWDFGDGTTSTAVNPAHKYNVKGVYRVKLTVSNSVGCSVVSNPIEVNAAYFNTDFASRPLCREASFTSTSYLYPSGSFWQFGDGSSSFGWTSASRTYATEGTYNVTLINTYGVCKDTVTKPVTVQELVNFNSNITMPSAVCQNQNVTFTSTSSTAPNQIRWDFGDGFTYNTNYPSFTYGYSRPGTYTVKVTNVFGTCSETVTKTIVVNSLPDLRGFTVNYGGICGAPVTVKFADTSAGSVSWKWQLNGITISTSQTAAYTFNSNGYNTVYLTVTNAAGCSSTVSKTVNVFRPEVTIGYNYSSSPRGIYDCDSLRIRFVASTNQTLQSYSWDFSNGTTSTSASPEAFFDRPGIYPIRLNYVTESGCAGTTSFSVRVYDKPRADFSYTVPCGNSLDLQFRDVSFFADAWQWNFGDGWATGYYSPTSHTYPDTGVYMVRMINHIGHCSDTIVKPVHANLLPASVSITKAENTCQGTRGTVTFDQRSLRARGTTWDFGDGVTIPYDTSVHVVKHTYNSSGTYVVKLTGIYGNCVLTSSVTVRVLLKQNPLLTANKTVICASDAVNIQINNMQTNTFSPGGQWGQYNLSKIEYNTGAAYSGNLNSWDWEYTTYNSTLSNFTAGVNRMRGIVTNPYTGCTDTTNYINLQVNGPVAGFKVQGDNLCFKSPFAFIDTSRSVTSTQLSNWYWDFGDGSTQINNNNSSVTHRYNNPGQYTVRLRVTDALGCNASFSYPVSARGTKAGFTPSGLYIPNVPLNTTVSFYNNSYSYNTNPVYSWNYGDGATSTGYFGTHTYTKPGVDTVRLIVSDNSIPCSDTAQKIITVKDFNTAFSFSTSFLGTNSCPPVLVRINNLSVGYTRLKWDFGDGTTSTSTYYPSHIYHRPGIYRITLYTYGYNGLTGTYIDSVEVKAPSVQMSADVSQACLSQTINLQVSAQNADSYLWDLGDGMVKSGSASIANLYSRAGVYLPRLIVKDVNGCPASADLPNKIVIDSLSVRIMDLPSLICDSVQVNFNPVIYSFSESNLNAPLSYKWDFGTGNPADTSNQRNPSFHYVRPGTYTARLTVLSPYGCRKETTASIVVHEKAKGRITAIPEVCQDGSVQFTGSTTSTGNIQWNWNFANGTASSVPNPAAQLYTTPGTYTVTLVLTKNGCMDTSLHALTVHPKPIVNLAPGQAVLCLGDNLSLSAEGGGSYQWSPAAGLNNAGIAKPVAAPQVTTRYKVLVTTDKGCVNTDSVLITVAQPVQVQLPSALDLCKGSTLQLNATGAATYQWINNVSGLSNTNTNNPVASPSGNSVYTVIGTDFYNCFRDTANVTVSLRDLPTVNAGPDIEVPGDIPYRLSATASSDVTSWSWSPSNGLSCFNCPSPMVTPKMETKYVVKVNNQWGCSASDTMLLKLACSPDHVYIPSAFTPNNDGKNDVFYIAGSGVKIIRSLRIYDRWGGVIFERTNMAINDRSAGWDGKVKSQPLGTGTYVYVAEIECSSGKLYTSQGTVTLIQ